MASKQIEIPQTDVPDPSRLSALGAELVEAGCTHIRLAGESYTACGLLADALQPGEEPERPFCATCAHELERLHPTLPF